MPRARRAANTNVREFSAAPQQTPMTALRIAVIGHALRAGGGVSVGHNLIASLLRKGRPNAYFCVVPEDIGYREVCEGQPSCQAVYFQRRGGYAGRIYFDEIVLPRLVARFKPDVVLALGNRGLSRLHCPQAILCQDAHLFYPKVHFGAEAPVIRLQIALNRRRLQSDLEHTQLVFCQTSVAATRLRETYKYTGTIVVAPNAISVKTLAGKGSTVTPAAFAKAKESFRLFCLTRYYAHKNLEAIVWMFDRFRDELRDVVVVVTISEDDHPNARSFLRLIRQRGLEKYIINVGRLSQTELSSYYRHCHALFLPTLLESFSGTYIEAMEFGCPILTSDLDFAHYICGDAAIYFDPWRIEDMKDAILGIKHNRELAKRLICNGSARYRTEMRSWDDVATVMLEQVAAIRASLPS